MTKLVITGGFYESISDPVSAQQLINAFVHTVETPNAYSPEIILGTPGIVQVASAGDGTEDRVRGSLAVNGVPYFVNGSGLFRLDSSDTLSPSLGTITGDFDQRVSMAHNGTQLMILVPGGDGFIYNTQTNFFEQILDPDFVVTKPQYVTFIDSYFVCSTAADDAGNPSGKRFIKSAVNDGLDWNALDFGTAEANPDDIVAPWAFRDRLYVFGRFTVESFENVGGADFPFLSIQGGLQNEGLVAPFSLVNGRDHMYWIGDGENEEPAIWRSTGQDIEKVSTAAIEFLIQNFSFEDLQTAYGIYEGINGNYFVNFHFGDRALCFNETNGKWHERQTLGGKHRVGTLVEAYGNLYVGDIFDGRIGRLDDTVFSEYEIDHVLRTLVTSPFNMDQDSFSVPLLELTMNTGEANLADPDPIIRLSVSRDGGRTYGPEDPKSLGGIGKYGRRVMWRKKGRFRTTDVMKFEFASPTKFIIIRLDARLKMGIPRFAA